MLPLRRLHTASYLFIYLLDIYNKESQPNRALVTDEEEFCS